MKKKEGFPGQISYVIPEKILEIIQDSPLVEGLFLSDIGYYPHASYHHRSRPAGISQSILIYNIAGNGSISLGGRTIKLPPDHYFVISPNVPHSYFADKEDPWTIYWIHLKGSKLLSHLKDFGESIPIDRNKTSRINERIELFNEIFRNLERGFSIETLEYVNLCLPHLIASFTHVKQFRSINDPLNNDPVNLAINFMLENLNLKLTLDMISKEVNLSPSYFSRIFLKQTGFSPIEYFIHLKIQRSCTLLENRALTIADVSNASGFEDQFYFSRQFRKVMDMSPSEYRKSRGSK